MKDIAAQHLRRRLAAPLAVWLIFQFPAAAADIVVGGSCSLRGAVDSANDVLVKKPKCTLGDPGADTIILTDDVSFSTPHGSYPDNALIVTSEIVLEGNGYTISRELLAAADFRIFLVSNIGDLTLKNTTVSGGRSDRGGGIHNDAGRLAVVGSTVSRNRADDSGGGIFNSYGMVSLENSTVSENLASGLYPYTLSGGGGIFNFHGTVTLENSTVSYNDSQSHGGGISNLDGTVSLTNTTVSRNYASGTFAGPFYPGGGGGIFNSGGGVVSLTNSSLLTNLVYGGGYRRAGGGILNRGGIVSLTNSSLSDNEVRNPHEPISYLVSLGGGIYNRSGTVDVVNSTLFRNMATGFFVRGGGIYNRSGTVNVTNSTLSGSTVSSEYPGGTEEGSAIYSRDDPTIITNSTIGRFAVDDVDTIGGEAALTNSIVYPGLGAGCGADITDGGNNFGCGTDVTNLDPTLADNGGPTLTHALLAGSNAIDAAGNCALLDPVLVADQRGAPRFDGNCDSGAFEFGGCPVLELADDTVASAEVHEECEIRVGPDFLVLGPGGDLTLTAGTQVSLGDGFGVETGAAVVIGIDGDLQVRSALEAAADAGWVPP